MQGKTKRVPLERIVAISEYFISLFAQECMEVKNLGHTVDFYAAINQLVAEGLLKKTQVKGDELASQNFKSMYDEQFA
jgi:hypothetical protein